MTDAERTTLMYAMGAPNFYSMACIVADVLCGATDGCNSLHIRETDEWKKIMMAWRDK